MATQPPAEPTGPTLDEMEPEEPQTQETPKASEEKDDGAFAAAARGVGRGLTFNFLDEAGAVVDTLGLTSGRENVFNSEKGVVDLWSENQRQNKDILEGDDKNHFGAALTGQIVGGLAVPFGSGARTVGAFARVGAVQGLVAGAGEGDTLAERGKDAAIGTAAGGVMGAALGGLVKGVRAVAGKVMGKAVEGVEEAVTDGTQRASAEGMHVGDSVPEGYSEVIGWGTDAETGERFPIVEAPKAPEVAPEPEVTTAPAPSEPAPEATDFTTRAAERRQMVKEDVDATRRTYLQGQKAYVQEKMANVADHEGMKKLGGDNPANDDPLAEDALDAADEAFARQRTQMEDAFAREYQQKNPYNGGLSEEALARIQAHDAETEALKAAAPRDGLRQLAEETTAWAEKAKAEGADILNLPASSPHGQFQLGNLDTPEGTSALLRSVVDRIAPAVPVSDEVVQKTALAAVSDMGEAPEDIIAAARSIAGPLGNAAESIATLRTAWAAGAREINDLHFTQIDWASADDSLVATAGEAIRNLSVLSSIVQEAKAGLGRGLRAIQLPDAESYLKQLAAKAAEGEVPMVDPRNPPPLPTDRQGISDWFDLWGMTGGDPSKQAQFLTDSLTVPSASKYLRTSFANLFTANILSGTPTIALNIAGPAAISLIRNLERMSGAMLGSVNPLASASEREASRAVARATPIAYLQTFGDIREALNWGMEAATRNRTVIGGGGQTVDALASYGPLTSNLLSAAGQEPSMAYTLGNLINAWPKAFARVNNGLDETAKRLAYQGEYRVRKLVEAYQKGLSGEEANSYVRSAMQNAYDEVGHAADQEMLAAAEKTTLTGQLGNEGSYARRIAQSLQGLRRDIPEARFLLPVFNVPANALGETLRRTPLAFIPKVSEHLGFERTAAELAGEHGPVAQADAHGRFLMGTAFLMGGLMLNRMGLITGAGPQDKADRSAWLQTHQPYSIRVGDEWVSYQKVDVAGGLLSIPATIADSTVNRPADESVGQMMTAGAGALAQWFMDRASLRTAAGLFAIGSDPTQKADRFAKNVGTSVATGLMGPAVLTRNLVNATDEQARMKTSWEDYMKAAIPGLSQTLEPVRNSLGEPMNRSADTYAEAFLPVTMAPVVTYEKDPVLDELARVYEVTGYGAGVDAAAWGSGYFNPKEVKLEDGKSLFDHAMKARQSLTIDGSTLRQSLQALFDSPEYNEATDARRPTRETPAGEGTREYMVKSVFDRYNKQIKADLSEASPLAEKYLTAAAVKAKSDVSMDGTSVEDLVDNPALYDAHGIDPTPYGEKLKGNASGALLGALQGQ